MALDKAIESGKEHRKPYNIRKSSRGRMSVHSKHNNSTCRNGGSCPWCRENRTLDRSEYSSRRDILEYKES